MTILNFINRIFCTSHTEATIRVPAGGPDVAGAGRERVVPARAPQPAAVRPLRHAELCVVGLRQPRKDADRRPGAADAEGAAAEGKREGGHRRRLWRGTQTRTCFNLHSSFSSRSFFIDKFLAPDFDCMTVS